MYCSNCGQELNNDAKFCSKCGTKTQNAILNNHPDANQELPAIICPKCNQFDRIEKVTSIVKSQTRTREQTEWVTEHYTDRNGNLQSYSYPRSYHVIEITDLSKHLSLPFKPEAKSASSCMRILGILLIFVGFIFILTSLMSLVDGNVNAGSWIGAVIFLTPGIIVIRAINNHYRKERKRVSLEMPYWENAIKIWNRLYYCYRNDIVFDSNDINNTFPPEETIRYCYQKKGASVPAPSSATVRRVVKRRVRRR